MFTDFILYLRSVGLKVSLTEHLALLEALSRGHAKSNLRAFYAVARALLVHKEGDLDRFDAAFASFFEGISEQFELDDELLKWLEDPKLPRALTDEEKALLPALDLDELREEFLKRLEEQKERHDGGNRWIGTGGTSPFGHGGTNPAGVRVGGAGGGRTAVQVAESRRFKNLRSDVVLDTRQIGVALRRLRRLANETGPLELHLDRTIDKTARDGGEIDLVFAPPRKNKVRVLLLMDVGGSMDPHALVSERLFSAAHAATHFAAFRSYFFHNAPYDHLYTDIERWKGVRTDDVLREIDDSWTVFFVGDAWMSPFELTHQGGAIDWSYNNRTTGLKRLMQFKDRCPKSVWLNPEPERIWHAESIAIVRKVFPMFELTVDGLTAAVDVLRGAKSAPETDAGLRR